MIERDSSSPQKDIILLDVLAWKDRKGATNVKIIKRGTSRPYLKSFFLKKHIDKPKRRGHRNLTSLRMFRKNLNPEMSKIFTGYKNIL